MPKYDFPNPILQNGHWSFTASLGIDSETGKRIQKRRGGFRTQREAEAAYRKLKAEWETQQAEREKETAGTSLTFGQFVADDFLPAYQGSVRPQTYRGRVAMIDKNFQALWNLGLNRISSQEILKWRRQCQQAGLSSDYVRKIYGLCERIFAMAVKIELISKNPAAILKDFKIKHDERATLHFWTLSDFQKVADSFSHVKAQDEWGLTILSFLFLSGLRIGETQALEWSDINFPNHYVAVNKTLVYRNAHNFQATPPKTKTSVRKVALSSDCLAQLKRWQERQKQSIGDCRYVFSTTGIPMNRNAVEELIRRKVEEVGVPRIRVHDLRHSHVSLLIHRKADPLLIRDRLGHSNVKIALEIYGKLYPNRDSEVAQDLDGLVQLSASEKKESIQQSGKKQTKKEGNRSDGSAIDRPTSES
ncbi:MAG: tyrosine-type recombinase/integrase [Sporolactobacillus sp.]